MEKTMPIKNQKEISIKKTFHKIVFSEKNKELL